MKTTISAIVGALVCGISLALAAEPTTPAVTSSVDRFHPVLTSGQHGLVRDGHLFFEDGATRTAAPEGEYTAVDGRIFIVGKKGAILTSRMR